MKQVKENHIPLSCHIELFLKTIDPILLYGAEVWGFQKFEILEKFRLRCLKSILHVRISTPSYMVYGELGIQPLECEIKSRMIGYWGKVITGKAVKFSSILYMISRQKQSTSVFTSHWNTKIEHILNETGFSYIWQQHDPSTSYLQKRHEIRQRIYDQSLQNIKSDEENSMKKKHYMLLKDDWKQEKYLTNIDYSDALILLKFRTDNHKLPVEKGRYHNIEYKDRICLKCRLEIGDKFHYLFSCPFFVKEREQFIPQTIRTRPNMYKYKDLLCHSDTRTLQKLSKFIRGLLSTFK